MYYPSMVQQVTPDVYRLGQILEVSPDVLHCHQYNYVGDTRCKGGSIGDSCCMLPWYGSTGDSWCIQSRYKSIGDTLFIKSWYGSIGDSRCIRSCYDSIGDTRCSASQQV